MKLFLHHVLKCLGKVMSTQVISTQVMSALVMSTLFLYYKY